MNNVRRIGFLLSGFAIACVATLSACTGVTDAGDNAFDSAAIDAIGDKVADWQLASGLWSTSLLSDDPNPTPETSGSSFMTYGVGAFLLAASQMLQLE